MSTALAGPEVEPVTACSRATSAVNDIHVANPAGIVISPGAPQDQYSLSRRCRYSLISKYWLNGFSIGSLRKRVNPASSATFLTFAAPIQAP